MLETYRRKRNFRKTPEPAGKAKRGKGKELSFVVQEHHASHLHYDFRLELDGVLKSWAVPKGPVPDPKVKRLAVEVEDHPLEYGKFAGEIPEHEYGAGEVLLWDNGVWEPEGEPHAALRKGHLDFSLSGKRMKGRWTLVRLRQKAGSKPNWLLFKRDDQFAGDAEAYVPLKDYGSRRERTASPEPRPKSQAKLKASALPEFVAPELPLLVEEVPIGAEWAHETKYDGYRIQARIDRGKVRLSTRTKQDWTHKYPAIAKALQRTRLKNAILDGEIVALDRDGKGDFQALQNAESADLAYYVFDILHLNGNSLLDMPLGQRKELLADVVRSIGAKAIRYGGHQAGDGTALLSDQCGMGAEGVVSKRLDSAYVSGRSSQWVKTKCHRRQEFVIGGYTDPQGSRDHFGALLLGVYRDDKLMYVGKCGTGFDRARLAAIAKRLRQNKSDESPFDEKSPRGRGIHWLLPKLVAEVEFASWTRDEMLRVPVFQGLRGDKPARKVAHEKPAPKSGQAADTEITHPEKILYAREKITKRDVADYYSAVAPVMVPWLRDRPLSLKRCPEGTGKQCFFQKHLTHVPKALHEEKEFVTLNSAEGLVALAQIGAFEIHAWGCRTPDIERADQIVMDFDPAPGVPFKRVKEAVLDLRKTLERLGLKSFLKVTGGKGLHVHIPLASIYTWDQIKEFSKVLADEMAARAPDRYTSSMSKSVRTGKIFVDYLRNGRSATAVAPYSLRARDVSSVALPIAWSELARLKDPSQFTLPKALAAIRRRKEDPWKEMPSLRQKISLFSGRGSKR